MHRRRLLAGTAVIALQAIISSRLPLHAASANDPFRRVRSGDPSWPSAASWEKLNELVGGSLIKVQPLFGACESQPTAVPCPEFTKNIQNPMYIGDQPGGTQVSGWLDAWTSAPSVYAVAARHSEDIVAAVKFARENKLRVVIKGGGHSYQGTSNSVDSLLIWTRAMNTITLHEEFLGEGCEGRQTPQPAVTIEAGAMWIDAYDAVTTKAGRYVQGGGCTTVGVAGLIQSGGFGSFSKGFGTAAASLLEAEIVTADGAVRIVNACRDPDLFWAIKGGGGGSWGVVTKLTLLTHDLPEHFGSAAGTIKARSDAAFHALIRRFVGFYSDALFNPNWGEQVVLGPDNTLRIAMNCQGLDKEQPAGIWQPFFEWVKANSDLAVTSELHAGSGQARHWWDAVDRRNRGSHSMVTDPRVGAPQTHAWWSGDQEQIGVFLYGYESVWLPSALLQKERQARLADALFASSRRHELELHFNKGLAGAPPGAMAAAADTAMNPAVLNAFALAIIADGGPPAYPGLPKPALDLPAAHESAREIGKAMDELRKVAPDAGSYVSESNYFERSWQRSYWGRNYARLCNVKDKYDPDGLFFVHHGVRSEDWSPDGFTRLTRRRVF